jgi:hypothetical protein
MADATQVLSRGMVRKLLTDQAFYTQFPAFRQLENKLRTMNVNLQTGRGCKGCKGRRVESNLFGDFLNILRAMTPERVAMLKKYLGVHGLMYSVQDPRTGSYETKVI